MSNKTQLQTNNTALDGYIARINAAKEVAATLPESGSSGGDSSINEACTVTISVNDASDSFIPFDYNGIYFDDTGDSYVEQYSNAIASSVSPYELNDVLKNGWMHFYGINLDISIDGGTSSTSIITPLDADFTTYMTVCHVQITENCNITINVSN